MSRDRRPIIHDSSYPLGGSRDRRRGGARDDGSLEARAALMDHARRSMGADAFAKWCCLLDYYDSALLGPNLGEGEGESAAMDGRVLDQRPGELAKMFPTLSNLKLAPNAGAGDREQSAAMNERFLDPRPSELAKMFPGAANPRLNFR